MDTSTQSTIKTTLIFRQGKQRGEYEKAPAVSKYNKMVVIADEKLNVKLDVSYDCELIPMKTGKGYFAISATKTPVVKTTLMFKKGRKLNEYTKEYMENMVGSFDGQIVIAPETMTHIQPNKEYDCEIVMSPNGRAYIVESAEPSTSMKEVQIITNPYPNLSVEVKLDGVLADELKFDCVGGDEKILQSKIFKLKCRSLKDKDMMVSNYEAACRDLMAEHQKKIFGK